jgi:anti-sigma factor RsiW
MRHYDDETLGAWVDGELDRQTAAALEADLRNDPTLRRRVAELRAISTALREWCAEQARPRDAVWPFAASADAPNGRRRRAARAFTPLWSHALAASLALLFGIGVGQFVNLSQRQPGVGDDAVAHRLLQAALEHTMSGQAISWTDDAARQTVTVQPLRTYRASGTFCREYRQTAVIAAQPDERTMYGLACRSREGTWRVEYTLASGARSILADQ